MTSTLLVVAIALVLGVLAALLSVAETALTRISVARAESLAGDGKAGADALVALLVDRAAALRPLLLVRVAAEVASVALVVVTAADRGGAAAAALTAAGSAAAVYAAAEATPRAWALGHLDAAALRSARYHQRMLRLLPLRWLASLLNVLGKAIPSPDPVNAVSEGELMALTEAAAAGDAIDDEERDLIESVFALGDTVVREAMVPRTDMTAVPAESTVSEVLDIASELGFSRMPVFAKSIDDIVGVSLVKDLTRRERSGGGAHSVRSAMRRPSFVPETKKAGDLLREMQAGRQHLAIVIDEYGGTAGLVTLEDLVEELVGEIVDEFDHVEPLFEPLAGGELLVHGRMPVDQVNDLLGVELDDGGSDTIGGLIFNILGHVPEVGDTVDNGSIRFRVERLEGRRITRVRLSPRSAPSGADSPD